MRAAKSDEDRAYIMAECRRQTGAKGPLELGWAFFGKGPEWNPDLGTVELVDSPTRPVQFRETSAALHYHLNSLLRNRAIQQLLYLAPRGSAKSTLVRMYVLWAHLYDPTFTYGWFCSANRKAGKSHLLAIRHYIESNTWIRDTWGDLRHPDVWSTEALGLFKPDAANMARPWKERAYLKLEAIAPSQKSGTARGAQHNGQRPQVLILDDPERGTVDDSEPEVSTAAFGHWLRAEVWPAMDRVGTASWWRAIWIANRTDDDNMAGALTAGCPYLDYRLEPYYLEDENPADEALKAKEHDDWLRFKWDCYQPDGSSYWPSAWPIGKLKAEERSYERDGRSHTFASEYRNRPTSAKTALFLRELFLPNPPGLSFGAAPEDADQAMDRWHGDLAIFGGLDPAISLSKTADYWALATGGRQVSTGKLLLFDLVKERLEFPDQIIRVFEEFSRWKWTALGIEAKHYQRALLQAVEAAAAENSVDIRVEPVNVHGANQTIRIQSLANLARQGLVLFPHNRPDITSIFTSYKLTSAHDDGPDATELMVSLARSYGDGAASAFASQNAVTPEEIEEQEREHNIATLGRLAHWREERNIGRPARLRFRR